MNIESLAAMHKYQSQVKKPVEKKVFNEQFDDCDHSLFHSKPSSRETSVYFNATPQNAPMHDDEREHRSISEFNSNVSFTTNATTGIESVDSHRQINSTNTVQAPWLRPQVPKLPVPLKKKSFWAKLFGRGK